jgi:hypothetical protein
MPLLKLLSMIIVYPQAPVAFVTLALEAGAVMAQSYTPTEACMRSQADVYRDIRGRGGYVYQDIISNKTSGARNKTLTIEFPSSSEAPPNIVWNNNQLLKHPRLGNYAYGSIFPDCPTIGRVVFKSRDNGSIRSFNR